MKVTPEQMEHWSNSLAGIYRSIEGEVIKIMIEMLEGNPADFNEWYIEKMSQLGLVNEKTIDLLSGVSGTIKEEVEQLFLDAGHEMVKDVDNALPHAPRPMPNDLDAIMKGFSDQTWRNLDNYINQSLITTNYGVGSAQLEFQNILNKTSAYVTSGVHSFEDGVERAVRELVDRGMQTKLTDRGGNTWSIDSYARSVIKTTMTNSYDKVRKSRMIEYGEYLVLVSSHAGAREACSKIQGQVVDLREPMLVPDDSKYRSIYDVYWEAHYKEAGGHRGINCRHIHFPFVDGVNTNNQPQFDEELNEEVAKARGTQRRLEREIVKYKKRLAVSEHFGHVDNIHKNNQLLTGREQRMEEHLRQNKGYLSRNKEREQGYLNIGELIKGL